MDGRWKLIWDGILVLLLMLPVWMTEHARMLKAAVRIRKWKRVTGQIRSVKELAAYQVLRYSYRSELKEYEGALRVAGERDFKPGDPLEIRVNPRAMQFHKVQLVIDRDHADQPAYHALRVLISGGLMILSGAAALVLDHRFHCMTEAMAVRMLILWVLLIAAGWKLAGAYHTAGLGPIEEEKGEK